MTPSAGSPTQAAQASRGQRVLRRTLVLLLAIASFVFVAAVAAVGWLVGTTPGLNALIALANRYAPVQIEAVGTTGALTREFGIAVLRVRFEGGSVEATEVRALLQEWTLRPPRIGLAYLRAARLRVDIAPSARPTAPIDTIGLPLELSVGQLRLDELRLDLGKAPVVLSSLQARVAAGPWGYRVEQGQLAYGRQRAQLALDLGSTRPFALQAEAAIRAEMKDQAVLLRLKAKGSLAEMTVDGDVSGAGSAGTLSMRIGSFDTPPVKSLQLDIAGIDPRTWLPTAPHADLTVKAQLSPNATMNEISGDVHLINRAPGTIDAQRIPARAARARLVADAKTLTLDRLVAELTQGTARGEFALQFGNDLAWQMRTQLTGVDPARLHRKFRALRIDGTVNARQSADTVSVAADLVNRGRLSATLNIDAQITAREAKISTARLALGSGFVTVNGVVGLSGDKRVEVAGELQNFDPGLLLKNVDARMNGTFSVTGSLQTQPSGRVRFDLADSYAWGRPLSAHGRIDVDALQRVDMDVGIDVRSARIRAKGGLGTPDRALVVALELPDLAELLPSDPKSHVSGALHLNATASGAWTAPAVQASVQAKGLSYGNHVLDSVKAQIEYGGGSDGELKIQTQLAKYTMRVQPGISIRNAVFTVDGRLSRHAIRIDVVTEAAGTALFAAEGGWRQAAWRGRVNESAIGAPVNAQLAQPADLLVNAERTEFGPARFSARDISFEEIRLTADTAGLQTSGRASDLRPMQLVPVAKAASRPTLAASGAPLPLTLRAQWDLRVGTLVDGSMSIERTGGDLMAGPQPDSALGLIELRAEATIKANELMAIARIETEKRGGIRAQVEASLEHSPGVGWRLAQNRPWLISAALGLPALDVISAALSGNTRSDLQLGGSVSGTLRVEGTPGNPRASGSLTADDLRIAWIDQGIRLYNGRLRAHLQEDLVVLDEFQFAGRALVQPEDKRAVSALQANNDSSLSASGQVRLRDFAGFIQVAANEFPVLQRPDVWVVVSGGANIETSARHVQVNGAVVAVGGYVDFSRSQRRSRSSDVVLLRAQESAAPSAPGLMAGFDLGIDLGPAFFVHGGGLDTRVDGVIRLRSAGRDSATAVGSISAVDGTYEGFGQKLKIARGRLNFQGAPANPGLDVLALRTGLPVEVGVTITRTAADPLVRLYSDPPMADAEALSWLVLGRAPDQGRTDNLALAQAAAALLGTGGYSNRVVRSLGIDDVSVRSGQASTTSLLPNRGVAGSLRSDASSTTTVAGEVVTLSKRLSDKLSFSYEQAVSGTSRVAHVAYQLSNRLSLVGGIGTENALDFVYSISFD